MDVAVWVLVCALVLRVLGRVGSCVQWCGQLHSAPRRGKPPSVVRYVEPSSLLLLLAACQTW